MAVSSKAEKMQAQEARNVEVFPEKNKQEQAEKQRFLFECMKENLVHARHVENERLTFISLLLVSTSMILNFSTSIGSPAIKLLLGLMLVCFNVICTKLLGRWNDVFNGHTANARKIMNELQVAYEGAEPQGLPSEGKLGADNRLYYFENTLGKKRKGFYGSTKTLFYFFNVIVYIVLLIFFLNVLFPSLSIPFLSNISFLF